MSGLRLRPILLAAVPAALILAVGGVSGLALHRSATTAAQVREAEAALHAVDRIVAQVADAVVDARGYALTGDSLLRAGTTGGRRVVETDLQALDRLVRAEPALAARARGFRTAIARQLDLADALVAGQRRRRGAAGTALATQVRVGSLAMDTLRAEVATLEAQVERALARREQDDARLRELAMAVLLGGVVLAALTAIVVHLALTRLLGDARTQAEDLERTNARLRDQTGELQTRREQLQDQALAVELANEQLREQATELELQTAQLQDQTVELEAANDTLRESGLRDQLLFERAPIPMWLFDAETLRFLAVNDAAVEHYGWTREEFLAMSIRDIRPPEDVARVEAQARDHRDGGTTRRATRHRTRDGRLLEAVVVAHDAMLGGRRVRIVTAEDATARTASERARATLEQQLRQSQKMEAVGRVAGGVAHDFNNLLTVVRTNLDAVCDALPSDSGLRAELLEAGEAVSRASALTRQLLTVSRQQHVASQPLDVGTVVRDAERLLRRLAGDRVQVRTALMDAPLVVHADVAQLEQVLMNLAVNARDAMPAGGTLTIATERRVALGPNDDAPRPWAVLVVGDTGVGMDAATRERIFEPFFTTKAPGAGTGLGLATAFGIVQQGGGFIAVESAPGAGARFEVYLRLADDVPAPRAVARPADLASHEPTDAANAADPPAPASPTPIAPPAPYAGPRADGPRRTPPRAMPPVPAAPRVPAR